MFSKKSSCRANVSASPLQKTFFRDAQRSRRRGSCRKTCMIDGTNDVAAVGIGSGRLPVSAFEGARLGLFEEELQPLLEQVMETEPLADLIGGHQEEVVATQFVESSASIVTAQKSIADLWL